MPLCPVRQRHSESSSPSLAFAALRSCVSKSLADVSQIHSASLLRAFKIKLVLSTPKPASALCFLALFMTPLRFKIIEMSLVPSFPLLPKCNRLILLLPCLVNQPWLSSIPLPLPQLAPSLPFTWTIVIVSLPDLVSSDFSLLQSILRTVARLIFQRHSSDYVISY